MVFRLLLVCSLLSSLGTRAISTAVGGQAHSAPGCASDFDCELNGQCVAGRCICSPQWYGRTCGQLRLERTIRNSGYRGGGAGALANAADPTSTWGASIIGPDDSGRWHMMVARMSLSCGLTSWKTNSEIAHAVASHPLGPYIPREPALIPRFAHNPTIHRSLDGAFYLYHIGCGHNSTIPLTTCWNGSTPQPPLNFVSKTSGIGTSIGSVVEGCDGPHWMSGLTAQSLDGPWLPFPSEITLASPSKTDHWLTNPAPVAMDNGTLLWLYRQNGGSWPGNNATSERLGVATASGWDAMTLEDLTPTAPVFPFPLEDQYVWRDTHGFYHALTHKGMPRWWKRLRQNEIREEPVALDGGSTPMAGHLFSRDGITWGIGVVDAPYNNTLSFTDGTNMQTGKRARPQLVVKNGVPTYLTTGAELPGHEDFVFTTVQPIAQG